MRMTYQPRWQLYDDFNCLNSNSWIWKTLVQSQWMIITMIRMNMLILQGRLGTWVRSNVWCFLLWVVVFVFCITAFIHCQGGCSGQNTNTFGMNTKTIRSANVNAYKAQNKYNVEADPNTCTQECRRQAAEAKCNSTNAITGEQFWKHRMLKGTQSKQTYICQYKSTPPSFWEVHSAQYQCYASHSGSHLWCQCNSRPWNTAVPYNIMQ